MNWLPRLLRRSRRAPAPASPSPFDVQRDVLGAVARTIFDVGAHHGTVAKEYRARFPDAVLHCFEPFPESFERLRDRWRDDPRVHCHPLALAAREGPAQLHANPSAATNSLLASDVRGASYWGAGLLETQRTVDVTVTTLDAFCRGAGIERIDVLKLDVQGAELQVLQGAASMLAARRIGLVYEEVILAPTYVGQPGLHDHLALLAAHGYVPFAFFDPVRNRDRWIQTDALFVSPDVLEAHEARARTARP